MGLPFRSLTLPAVVTQVQAQSVADQLVARVATSLSKEGDAVLDASALAHFDSTALAVILACRRAAAAQGGVLHVKDLPARAQTLAKVYGLSELMQSPSLAN